MCEEVPGFELDMLGFTEDDIRKSLHMCRKFMLATAHAMFSVIGVPLAQRVINYNTRTTHPRAKECQSGRLLLPRS